MQQKCFYRQLQGYSCSSNLNTKSRAKRPSAVESGGDSGSESTVETWCVEDRVSMKKLQS
eukprot:3927899-Rhodomonas_salina.1